MSDTGFDMSEYSAELDQIIAPVMPEDAAVHSRITGREMFGE